MLICLPSTQTRTVQIYSHCCQLPLRAVLFKLEIQQFIISREDVFCFLLPVASSVFGPHVTALYPRDYAFKEDTSCCCKPLLSIRISVPQVGLDSSVAVATSYGLHGTGIESPWVHPASYVMGTRCLSRGGGG
jgi:hypothetical protein